MNENQTLKVSKNLEGLKMNNEPKTNTNNMKQTYKTIKYRGVTFNADRSADTAGFEPRAAILQPANVGTT